MLELQGVTKSYRAGRAVEAVSLGIGRGVLGLLGPNGAGKSSLMRILATVTRPSAGSVTWNGTSIVSRPGPLRRVLGYLPQDFGIYPNLTAVEFLSYLGAAKGLKARAARERVHELLDLVNLADAGKRPLGVYSGGMRQRVGIAQALLNDPGVLIVDEPTVGLDPEERMRLRHLLGELGSDRIVILSTHIVSDVESVAEDIAILAQGRLVRRGSPEELMHGAEGLVWDVLVPAEAVPDLRGRYPITRITRVPEGVRARVLAPSAPVPDAAPAKPGLEEAYLHTLHPTPRDPASPGWQAGAAAGGGVAE